MIGPDPTFGGDGSRYQREELLAVGGMGEVWRARDTLLGREVAVKVLKQEYAEDPTFRERFAAEARHAAGLHHPGIASVFDYGMLADGPPFLVMELVHGKPLSALLSGGRPLDPEQARALVGQAAEALGAAHAAGVVHRDVKPANLMVTPDGRVKITDFGIARAADSAAITQTGQIVGTRHYLSPEQAEGQSATAASDVYALGVLLFECLTGARPFVADTPVAIALAHIRQEAPALPQHVPPDLAAITRRALAKDPADRYPDGAAFAAALQGSSAVPPPAAPVGTQAIPVPSDTPEPAEPATLTTAVPGPGRRPRWPLYAGGLVLLLLAALLVMKPWSEAETTGSGDPTAAPVSSGEVQIDRSAYVGRPVAEVRKELRRQDLRSSVEPRDNDGSHQVGTVADIFPTGTVARGTRIRLQVWGPASGQSSSPPPAQPKKSKKPKPSKSEHGPDQGNESNKSDAPPSTPPSGKPSPTKVPPTKTDPDAGQRPGGPSPSSGNGGKKG